MYGQSVFETIAIDNGRACLLEAHLDRLRRGSEVLKIPLDSGALEAEIAEILDQQAQDQSKASHLERTVLRVTLSMGEGGRGYLNPQQAKPCRVLSLHAYPDHPITHWLDGIELGVADIRLSNQPVLAGIKHGNRLEQIIARSQWQDTWGEALMLDQSDNVIEGTQSNVFVIKGGDVLTPSLAMNGVAGVVREFVISNAHRLGLTAKTVSLSCDNLESADEVFLSNSIIGLWPVKKFNTRIYTNHEVSHKLLKLMIKNEVIPHYKS